MRYLGFVFLLLVCLSFLFLASCNEQKQTIGDDKTQSAKLNASDSDYEKFRESVRELAVCGYYSFDPRNPIYNLTGKFKIKSMNGSEIYLTSLLNVSLEKAVHAADNCMPLFRATVDDEGRYRFEYLQEGKYVLFIRTDSFPSMNVELPLPGEINDPCVNLTIQWQGGSQAWSMSAFILNEL